MPTKVVRASRIGRKGGAPRAIVDEAFARVFITKLSRLRPIAMNLGPRIDATPAAAIESYATTAAPLTPSLAINVNPTTGFAGTTATLATATVTGSGPTPTGTVQFKVNGTNVGGPQTLVAGVGTLNIPGSNFPTAGTAYTVTYTYSGDGHYPGATSPNATYTTEPS